MIVNGNVKLSRQAFQSRLWLSGDLAAWRLFETIFGLAAFQPTKMQGFEVDRGALVIGLTLLAEISVLSRMTVYRKLPVLKEFESIRYCKVGGKLYISVINYDLYQD